jgi:hypothetical protein
MNERIKHLAEQAGLKLPVDTEYNGHIYRHALEKFAKSIVQDCIQTLHSNGYDDAAKCLQDINFGIDYPI